MASACPRCGGFRTTQDRFENREALGGILMAEFEKKTSAKWADILRGHVPFAPVNTVAEALEDLRRTLERLSGASSDQPTTGAE